MKQMRIYGFVAGTVICALLLTAGCAEPAKETAKIKVEPVEAVTAKVEPQEQKPKETTPAKVEPQEQEPKETAIAKVEPKEQEPQEQKPPVKLALKFTPEDSTTYRVIIEAEKSIKWEGPPTSKPSAFKGGHTGNKIETTFTQQIQSTDDKGNAVAKITIKELKYLAKVKDNIVLEFDSTKEKDQSSPLNKLIGQSYTIEITASGQVLKVIDASDARAAVRGSTPANRTAIKLLSENAIKERHTISALPAADKDQLQTGENWSSIRSHPLSGKSKGDARRTAGGRYLFTNVR
jgi:hypothetical protein